MVVLTQITLDAVSTYIVNNLLPYMTVGTGDDPITVSATDIETPVQIGSSDRNKIVDSTTITDNFFVKEFKITSAEPDTQPVNISEVGIQSGLNVTDKLAAGFVFLASTKDNASQWTVRFQGKTIEGV